MQAILHLTKNCNLRCRYCYAPAGEAGRMSSETGRQAVDFALSHGVDSACMGYFGGEPLLEWELIRELTAYAEERAETLGKPMFFRLSTNGLLLDEKKLRYIREHNIHMAISLDGVQAVHDARRVHPDGRGSWREVDERIDMILEYMPSTIFVSVLSPDGVEQVADSLQYMRGRGIKFTLQQPDFTNPDWTPQLFERLEVQYRRMAAFMLDCLRNGRDIYIGQFNEKIRSHINKPLGPGLNCDVGRKKISVAPDGSIFPCVQFVSRRPDALKFRMGHVASGFDARRDEIVQANCAPRRQCSGCDYLGRCHHGCTCMAWQLTGDIMQVPPIMCAYERMVTPIADEIGNTLWEEKNEFFMKRHYGFLEDYPAWT